MTEKNLVPVSLSTAEVPLVPIDPDHGERVDRGRVIAALPASMKPCPVVYDEPVVRHDDECECGGRGEVPIRRPEIEVVDPEDDSLQALQDALETGNTVDAHLGDSVTNLMHRDVDVKGGGGGGGRRRRDKATKIDADAPRSAIDGRLERTGRKPRFVKIGTRKDMGSTTIAPRTVEVIQRHGSDVAALADDLLADPEMQAVLAEIRTSRGGADPANL